MEWADARVLRPISRALLVCFGALWKQPKRATENASRSSCQQAYEQTTQNSASLIFCSNHTELFRRLHAAECILEPKRPRRAHLDPLLILNLMFTPHKNSICLVSLIFRTEKPFFVIYERRCILGLDLVVTGNFFICRMKPNSKLQIRRGMGGEAAACTQQRQRRGGWCVRPCFKWRANYIYTSTAFVLLL